MQHGPAPDGESSVINTQRKEATYSIYLHLRGGDTIIIDNEATWRQAHTITEDIMTSIAANKTFLKIRTGHEDTPDEREYTILTHEVSHLESKRNQ